MHNYSPVFSKIPYVYNCTPPSKSIIFSHCMTFLHSSRNVLKIELGVLIYSNT